MKLLGIKDSYSSKTIPQNDYDFALKTRVHNSRGVSLPPSLSLRPDRKSPTDPPPPIPHPLPPTTIFFNIQL